MYIMVYQTARIHVLKINVTLDKMGYVLKTIVFFLEYEVILFLYVKRSTKCLKMNNVILLGKTEKPCNYFRFSKISRCAGIQYIINAQNRSVITNERKIKTRVIAYIGIAIPEIKGIHIYKNGESLRNIKRAIFNLNKVTSFLPNQLSTSHEYRVLLKCLCISG